MTDEYALNVTYRDDRGEPRASVKEGKKLKAAGEAVGDCVDCYQCVAVCPTGTDIRPGSQLLHPVRPLHRRLHLDHGEARSPDRPHRLRHADQLRSPQGRPRSRSTGIVRPRTILYAVLISAVLGFMTYVFVTRGNAGVNVLHDRNPLYVQNSTVRCATATRSACSTASATSATSRSPSKAPRRHPPGGRHRRDRRWPSADPRPRRHDPRSPRRRGRPGRQDRRQVRRRGVPHHRAERSRDRHRQGLLKAP